MSPFDAVDGSSTGTEVPWMWVLLRPPRFGGARYATGYDNRSPPRERAGALTVYVRDLHRFAPMVDKVQTELWSKPPYPPRTIVEVQRLFDDDIVEIDSAFYAPVKR